MLYFTVINLCTAGLFLVLLEDRFRVFTTVGIWAAVYALSLVLCRLLKGAGSGGAFAGQLPCAASCMLFFIASLFIYVNNPVQKLFLALLSFCNFEFLSFFIPLALGVMPFNVSGAAGGFLSASIYVLFTLFIGLCLYRPFKHFSDRGASGFMLGMCLALIPIYVLSRGWADFLFRTSIPAARLIVSAAIYCCIIFGFRSIYQAGRFRERTALGSSREHMLEMELGDYTDMLASIRAVRSAQKAGEYALDTVNVMLADGAADRIPAYISETKRNSEENPILKTYHDDPYINAVLATKAAFCAQNGVDFSCSVVVNEGKLKASEICVVINELLTRACDDAAHNPENRFVSFTVFPSGGVMSFETIYSCRLPEKERFSVKGKSASDIFRALFEDAGSKEDSLKGLDNVRELVGRLGGKLSVSAAGSDELILHLDLRCA